MLDFLCDVFWLLCGIAVELLLFGSVEKVTQKFIAKASNDREEQGIWLLECAALFLLCALINVHHTPYFLFPTTCFALVYTNFLRKMHFGRMFQTIWEDFSEIQDSLNSPNTSMPEQPQSGATLATPGQPAGPQNQVNAAPSIPLVRSEPPLAFPAGGGGTLPRNRSPEVASFASSTSNAPGSLALSNQQLARTSSWAPRAELSNSGMAGTNFQPSRAELSNTGAARTNFQPSRDESSNAGMVRTSVQPHRAELDNTGMVTSSTPVAGKRVSASEENKTCNNTKTSGAAKFLKDVSTSFRAWFVEPFTGDRSLPPGLVNSTQTNLCFINCILQTLSRSSRLTEHLRLTLASGCTQNLSVSKMTFIREVVEVFHNLTVADKLATPAGKLCYHKSPLNTEHLRKAISAICMSDLVEDPSSGAQQPQQDAAEFLLWILNTLHEALKVQPLSAGATSLYTRPSIHQPLAIPSSSAFSNNSAQASLNKLRADYNNPSSADIQSLRQSCLQQIAAANGRLPDTYVRPVATISDLDWLSYKDQNNSIIDDLFTGQQVSACLCDRCNRISVTTDTFRILTLPIPLGYECVGIVNCFEELTRVENLTGLNQRKCDFCTNPAQNRFQGGAHHLFQSSPNFHTSTPNGPVLRRSVGLPSPIEGVNHDQRVETPSTPGLCNPLQLTNADSQKQTCVRQLPECLVVQLLRFGFVDRRQVKIYTRVSVSVEPIDLSSLIVVNVTPRAPMFYTLYGMCLHSSGSTSQSGHYYAFSLASDGHWYLFNDEAVKRVDIEHELSQKDVQESIYILYYRKI